MRCVGTQGIYRVLRVPDVGMKFLIYFSICTFINASRLWVTELFRCFLNNAHDGMGV